MKILNILLFSTVLAVVAVPVAFGYANEPQNITAQDLLKQDAQNHDMKMACSGFDPRCGE